VTSFSWTGRTTLITGASSGIGAAFAAELARRGSDLILVARREERLKKLAEQLQLRHDVTAHTIAADLSVSGATAEIGAATDGFGATVDVLVNNAGFGTCGRYETIDPSRDQQLVAVGVTAVVDLTHRYLPGMVARGTGAVINVSSMAAFAPLPYRAVYGASKAFVQSFSEALWAEHRRSGVRVVACCPAATDTEYFEVAGSHEFGRKRPPSGVVDAALRAVDGDRPHTIIGPEWRMRAGILRFLPRRTVVSMNEKNGRPPSPQS
jgi:short-subunit dehydrogenase